MELESDAKLLDLVDDKWREEKLPFEDVQVPLDLLPDPEADSKESNLTLRELEQQWTDLNLGELSENREQT